MGIEPGFEGPEWRLIPGLGGKRTDEIAEMFGVHWVTVNDIKRGKSWKKIPRTITSKSVS